MPTNGWTVVGISGMTNAGKTSLSRRLAAEFPGSKVLNQDIYFREPQDPKHIWIDLPGGGRHQNWEHLVSIDWDRLIAALERDLSLPPDPSATHPLLMIEGHLILSCTKLATYMDHKIWLSLSQAACLARRLIRTYDPPDPPHYFDACIWPMAVQIERNVKAQHPDLVAMSGEQEMEQIFQRVKGAILKL